MGAGSYREQVVWQKSMEFVEAIYRATRSFPKEEICGLTRQMRRAAVSIPCNIAEGQGRQTTKDFLHFLWIARGSLRELETQILIAERLTYLSQPAVGKLLELADEIGRMINALCSSLNRRLA